MTRTILMLLLGATAFAAPAAQRDARGEAALAKQLDGLVAGEPRTCITPSRTRNSSHAGNTVLIRDLSNTLYRNQFLNGCTARESDALILRTTSTQLCRGEIVEVRDLVSGFSNGSCVYGDFTPYRKPR